MIPTLATDQNRTLNEEKSISARRINHRRTPTACFSSLRRSHRRAMKCIGEFVLSIIVRWREKKIAHVYKFASFVLLSLSLSLAVIRPTCEGGGRRRRRSSCCLFSFLFRASHIYTAANDKPKKKPTAVNKQIKLLARARGLSLCWPNAECCSTAVDIVHGEG